MVIFHSYVSLPEGITAISGHDEPWIPRKVYRPRLRLEPCEEFQSLRSQAGNGDFMGFNHKTYGDINDGGWNMVISLDFT